MDLTPDDARKALEAIVALADVPNHLCASKRTVRLALVLEIARKALVGVKVEDVPQQ